MTLFEWISAFALILGGFWAVGMALLSAYKKQMEGKDAAIIRAKNELTAKLRDTNAALQEQKRVSAIVIKAIGEIKTQVALSNQRLDASTKEISLTRELLDRTNESLLHYYDKQRDEFRSEIRSLTDTLIMVKGKK